MRSRNWVLRLAMRSTDVGQAGGRLKNANRMEDRQMAQIKRLKVCINNEWGRVQDRQVHAGDEPQHGRADR